jgi:hypothetical protein
MKNLFTSSFLSKLNAAQFVNGLNIGFRLARTGVFVQALNNNAFYCRITIKFRGKNEKTQSILIILVRLSGDRIYDVGP